MSENDQMTEQPAIPLPRTSNLESDDLIRRMGETGSHDLWLEPTEWPMPYGGDDVSWSRTSETTPLPICTVFAVRSMDPVSPTFEVRWSGNWSFTDILFALHSASTELWARRHEAIRREGGPDQRGFLSSQKVQYQHESNVERSRANDLGEQLDAAHAEVETLTKEVESLKLALTEERARGSMAVHSDD